jgi:selenocysteine lyase/cysteine desulfurase
MLNASLRVTPAAPTEAHDRAYFASLRAREFARLDQVGEAYLDYTGSGLHADRQVRLHASLLRRRVFGNPHSESGPSRASTDAIEEARRRVLAFFEAPTDEWEVVFTANATAALRLVGEGYDFGCDGTLVLSADNHNSVNGLREYAATRGARVHYLPLDAELRADEPERHLARLAAHGRVGLLAFPAQSNFSGVRHPLALAAMARRLGFDVLLDAASFVAAAPLSLAEVEADFVCLSFYKLFGYPTGLGALLARREALARLRRPWFAGGTVQFASVLRPVHLRREGAEGFEDGTPSFQAVSALPFGFDLLEEIGPSRLARRAHALTARLLAALMGLRHPDGRPAVVVYGPRDLRDRGACVSINVTRLDGTIVPYDEVESRARAARVSLRGGCFCNPGAAERAFGLGEEAVRCQDQALARGFSIPAFRDCLGGGAVGAVRLSLGIASSEQDVDRAVEVVARVAGVERRA